jgi:hypothetical protein
MSYETVLLAWKRYGRDAIDAIVGSIKGGIGIDPAEGESKVGRKTNLGIQALTAGLPFAALRGGKPIYHGTGKVFEKFDPSKYDTSDILGWMTHGAADPDYAAEYAFGNMKGSFSLQPKSNIIAMQPQAKNVLDLVDPNADDISQILASFSPERRRELINEFKNARQKPERAREYLSSYHYPDKDLIPEEEIPVRYMAESLRLEPGQLEKTPFDAIRYHDVNKESFAIPSSTPIKAHYSGAPLTEDPTPLKVIRSDKSGAGVLEVAEDRWANTPLPEVSYPEKHKWTPSNIETTAPFKKGNYEVFNPKTGEVKEIFTNAKMALDYTKIHTNLDFDVIK